MVTLQTADNALKSFYLDAVADVLDQKANPFLARVKRTERGVAGKDVKVICRTGVNGGFVAGTETGELPAASEGRYVTLTSSLKNLYGTIEISDKAIRASAKDEGAFVNLLEDEMSGLVKSASINFGRMLFGDGSALLAENVTLEDEYFQTDAVNNFFAGMFIDVIANGVTYEGMRIYDVNRENGTVYFTSDLSFPVGATGVKIYLHDSKDKEITGLKAVFDANKLYGAGREYSFMKPTSVAINGQLDLAHVQKVIDDVEENSGKKVDYVICSNGVKRALMRICRENNIALPTVELDGGVKALDFYGIPVVADRFCPKGEMYLLSTECFKICQLCDWQWLEAEDGKILKQVPGKPVYTATLVKYAELICDMPCAQGRITAITEE